MTISASQVILTNAAFMLEKQLEEATKENIQLRMENAKLKSKLESIRNVFDEAEEIVCRAEVSE